MRIYPSPLVVIHERAPIRQSAPACRRGNVSACAKFPRGCALLPQDGLADAITPDQVLDVVHAARFSRSNSRTVGTVERRRSFNQAEHIGPDFLALSGICSH